MKYKDYYKVLGVERNASADDIRKAYRKLAHKYHPDVSKETGAKEKFQEVGEAYDTLKNPEKRAAYDQLGRYQPGQDFQPPPDWGRQFGDTHFSFDDLDLADLFAGLSGGRRAHARGGRFPIPGEDYEVAAQITLEQAAHGAELDINLSVPEYDEHGVPRRVPRTFKARIAKGASEGQRLRLPGKGGKGCNGGRDGDLYLNVKLLAHPRFRPSGHDLYIDLPLAPWEAVLGATVEVPTLDGAVRLKVPAGTRAGQQLRLARRGLPRPREGEGDLYAVVQIVLPAELNEHERALFKQLADGSKFNPRSHLEREVAHASRAH
ncbi:MAG: DnaJ domain-containing protein [Betaproteobacteria bacterium]|nr:DnaJ domain-containing protein [Betaproteobacteria bacterium]